MDPLDSWPSFKGEDPSLEGLGLTPGAGFGPQAESIRFEASPFDEGIPLEAGPLDIVIDETVVPEPVGDGASSDIKGDSSSDDEQPRRKRRRGRRGGRRRKERGDSDTTRDKEATTTGQDEKKTVDELSSSDLDFDEIDESIDDIGIEEADELDDDEAKRTSGAERGRRPSSTDGDDSPKGLTERDRKLHPKIPSWEQAINVLVEANIANHATSRNSPRRDSNDGERGRRRRRSSSGGRRGPEKRGGGDQKTPDKDSS